MRFRMFGCCCGGRRRNKVDFVKKKKKGLNQITPSIETKLKNLEVVLKELECPVCFNTCVSPITCVNGHIICSRCRRNVTVCPTCREPFSTVRNLFAENFIEQYSQSCKFSKDGCKFLRWKGDNMQPHEGSCPYRMIKCLVPSCSLTVGYRSLLSHLKENHKIGGTTELPVIIHYVTDNECPIRDRKWLPYYIMAYGCTFYVMLEIIRPFFWTWVWVHCPKAELTERFNFTATVKFHSPKTMSLEWRGPVYPIRITGPAIIRDGLCFGGPDSWLQHFEQDGELLMSVNIEPVPGGISDGSLSDGGPPTLESIESEVLATGDIERDRNFSQLILAASQQLLRRRVSTIDPNCNHQETNQAEFSGRATPKKSNRHSN